MLLTQAWLKAPQPISPFFIDQGATSLESNSVIGASWYLLPTDGNALPQDESLKILVMQVTTTGAISGSLNCKCSREGNQDSSLQYVHTFNGEGMFEGEIIHPVEGCQDESACNYDPDATSSRWMRATSLMSAVFAMVRRLVLALPTGVRLRRKRRRCVWRLWR